ncbi:MAG: GNAT family N-acetyltransferase [Opitutaceae bacterium]
MPALEIKVLTGAASLPYTIEVGRLRVEIFRDWPYLYKGTLDYEKDYLKHYAASKDSVVALALVGENVVGASTALPLVDASREFRDAFQGSEFELESIYYLGESILQPAYRGQGIGHSFFDAREAQARKVGAKYTAFCAVDRSSDDPRRPNNYRSLDTFWNKRGYQKHPSIQATFDWREVGQSAESPHTLSFWIKPLSS